MDDESGLKLESIDRIAGDATGYPDHEWIPRLRATGHVRDEAIGRLHLLLVRAARQQIARMPEGRTLGAVRRDEAVQAAADHAAVSVLARLDDFEGRSRFTTWAYKFAILQAATELRRTAWRQREVAFDDVPERFARSDQSPEIRAESSELAAAVRAALANSLTAHQRRVAMALLIDEVPIDVLADRLQTTRGALYKTLHDARKRLRGALSESGLVPPEYGKDGVR